LTAEVLEAICEVDEIRVVTEAEIEDIQAIE